MKKIFKYFLIVLATLAVVVAIVISSGVFWIQSDNGRQWLETQINSRIPGNITVAGLELSLLQPSLSIEGVVVKDPQGRALAGFGHFSAGFDWKGLMQREIRVDHILLQEPWADVVILKNGNLNLMTAVVPPDQEKKPEPATSGSGELPFNIVVDSVQLTSAHFTFISADEALHLEATGLNITGGGNFKKQSGNLELSVDEIRFRNGAMQPLPANLQIKAQLDGEQVSITTFKLASGQTAVNLSGSADQLYTEPIIDAVLTINSQLAELAQVVPLAGDYSGRLDTRLSVQGKMANPDGNLKLSLGQAVLAGQPLDSGEIKVVLKDRQVAIDQVALRLADGKVDLSGTVDLQRAFPTGFLAPSEDFDNITYDIKLIHDIPHLNPWLQQYVDLQGATDGQLSLTGKGVIPAKISARMSLQATGRQLLASGTDRPVDADIQLMTEMDSGTVTISELNVDTEGLKLTGDGRFQMDEQKIAAKVSLAASDLAQALAVAGLQSISGACTADLRVDGSVQQPQFSLDLATENLKFTDYSLGDLQVKANMDQNGLLQLTTLQLQNKGSRINGKARLRLLPMAEGGGIDPEFVNKLELSLDSLSPADFMQVAPINGTIDGRLQADGILSELQADLALTSKGLSNDTVTIGDINSRIRLTDGTVFIDKLQLNNKDSALRASGSIKALRPGTLELLDDPLIDLTADASRLDPADFVDSASGNFSFKAAVKGSVAKPVGRITLTGKNAKLAGQPLEKLAVDARFKDERLWLDQLLVLLVPGQQLKGGGTIGLDKTMDLSLQSTPIAVSSIQQLQEVFPGKANLQLDVTAKGKVDNPDVEGKLVVSDIVVREQAMEDGHFRFSLHDMLAKVQGKLNFDLQAAYELRKGDFNGGLSFDRTETAAYFKAAGQPDLHGTLSGEVKADGNISDAMGASVQVDLSALQLFFKDVSLVQSNRIALQLADRQLSVPPIVLSLLTSGKLQVQGEAQVDGALNMQIDGQIPLAVAGYFSDELSDAAGKISLQGDLTGTTADPLINGGIDIDNVAMTVPGLVQKLHDLNGRIVITPTDIRIEALKGFLDTGSFSLNGTVGHEKFVPTEANLDLTAKALPVEVADTLSLLLNADIKLSGKDRLGAVTGEIVLLEGLYYKDIEINLLEIATDRKRSVAPPAEPITLPYFDAVKLDVKVKNRQPFYVQNNLADLEINPDLRVVGDLNRPIIGGRALVKSGTITFQKKIFEVKKGVIDFVNPYRTEASVDIESETTIRDWTITLAIKGTPDNLQLKLSSVPAESDSDILSLILFGRTGQELVSGEGGGKRSNAQIMAGMIADTFGDDIKKNTGLDILQLETGDGGATNDTKVTVGKNLSNRLTLKYAVESSDGTVVQRAITEYKLLERILLSGFQDSEGVFGGELMFRIEFR